VFGLFGKNWTAKTEYLFVDLGRSDWRLANSGFQFSTRLQEHIFRSGVSYHFNQPVVAKYGPRLRRKDARGSAG
jgi:outer membrane immunogenic protein